MSFWKILGGALIAQKVYGTYKENKSLKKYEKERESDDRRNEEIGEIVEKIKNVDFEPIEEKLEDRNINKLFFDEVIEKYINKVKITIESIDPYDETATVDIKLEKPDFDILKYDLLSEWDDLKEKIEKNDFSPEVLHELRMRFSKILKKEDELFFSEQELTVFLNKKNYEWELEDFSHEEFICSLSEIENFIDIIDEIRDPL